MSRIKGGGVSFNSNPDYCDTGVFHIQHFITDLMTISQLDCQLNWLERCTGIAEARQAWIFSGFLFHKLHLQLRWSSSHLLFIVILTTFLQCFNRKLRVTTDSPFQFLPSEKVEHSLGKNFKQASSNCLNLKRKRQLAVVILRTDKTNCKYNF